MVPTYIVVGKQYTQLEMIDEAESAINSVVDIF